MPSFVLAVLLLIAWLCGDCAPRCPPSQFSPLTVDSLSAAKRLWSIVWCLYIASVRCSASETAPPSVDHLELLLNSSTTACSVLNHSWPCKELKPSESELSDDHRNTLYCPHSTICILRCRAIDSCSGLDVVAESNSTLLIGCTEPASCRDVNILAKSAHYVLVESNDNRSLSYSSIQCPTENLLGRPNCVVRGSCTDFEGADHCRQTSERPVSAVLMMSYLVIYAEDAASDVEVSCDDRATECMETSTSLLICSSSPVPRLCYLWYDPTRCQFGCKQDSEFGDHDGRQCRPAAADAVQCETELSVTTSNRTSRVPVDGAGDHWIDEISSFLGLNALTLCVAVGSLCLLCLCCVAGCGVRRRRAAAKQREKGHHLEEEEMGNMVVIDEEDADGDGVGDGNADRVAVGGGGGITKSAARKRKGYWQRADGTQRAATKHRNENVRETSPGAGHRRSQRSASGAATNSGGRTSKALSDHSTASGRQSSVTFERHQSKRRSCSSGGRSRSHHDGLEDEAAKKLASSKLGDDSPLHEMVMVTVAGMSAPTEHDADHQYALRIQQEQLINANHHQQLQRTLNMTLHRPTPYRGDVPSTPSRGGLTPMVPHMVTRVATDSGIDSKTEDGGIGMSSDGFNLGGGFTFNVDPSSTHFSRSRTCSLSASSEVFDPEQYRGVDADDDE